MVGSRRRPCDDLCDLAVARLSADLLANIHRRLPFLHRLAFASLIGASGHMLTPEAPWLVLPGRAEGNVALISVTDGGKAGVAPAPYPAMRGHVVLGSSDGWLVTADAKGALRMANTATGAQADLPAISTIPMFLRSDCWFTLDGEAFVQLRFGGTPPPDDKTWGPPVPRTFTMTAEQMRQWFYRKVVLSSSPRPDSYAAMLILDRTYGVPAFATVDDPNWRMAPSQDGVEDAIHHDGRFYSISYTGIVEVWDRDVETGDFKSMVVAPDSAVVEVDNCKLLRRYLATTPDGRLMVVLKGTKEVEQPPVTRHFFQVLVLDEAHGTWEKEENIDGTALFVGVNSSLCVSTREHPAIKPGCVYFTDDEIGVAAMRHDHEHGGRDKYRSVYDDDKLPYLGVYSLNDGKIEDLCGIGKHPCWPPAAWVTPSFL
ncbi:hypothetical protein ACP70R_009254 [Stipagrostis hirtigluma subsp. patula]